MHPDLKAAMELLFNLKENFEFSNEGIQNALEEIALNISAAEVPSRSDTIRIAADKYVAEESTLNAKKLKQEIFSVFYKVGLVHVKTSKGSTYKACYNSSATIDGSAIDENAKFKIDPTFWRSFSITPNIG